MEDEMEGPIETPQDDENNSSEKVKPEETFTKPLRDGGMITFIEREVDRFDFDGYEVVRKELFSKANCPAVTLKYGKVMFNSRAIRKLDACSHVHILINSEKKLMIAKPCAEEEKDSVQWSKIDRKSEKSVTRQITGKYFTAQLFEEMKWDINSTIKILGTLLTCKDEKIFIFNLVNAEAYISVSAMDPDDPKRRRRIPLIPEHWQGHYGQSYEESRVEIVKTFEGVPEGFVKITLPQMPVKKLAADRLELFENKNEVKDDTIQ
jgi:hypothetical protein